MAVKRRMPMCYFNDLERINNKNEIQTMIRELYPVKRKDLIMKVLFLKFKTDYVI